MKSIKSWKYASLPGMVLFGMLLLPCMFTDCNESYASNAVSDTLSLRIYEMAADEGTFLGVGADGAQTVFQLTLGGLNDLLFFTNRGAMEAGYETVDNLVNTVWPEVYAATGPNAVVRYSAGGTTHRLLCVLNNPVYDASTGLLDFTITYLEGQRPVNGLALSDVKMFISNNAAQVQPPEWSTILDGKAGTLNLTNAYGVYRLTIKGLHENLFDFTSAPHRNSMLISADDLIRDWETRFGSDPPNASLSYSRPFNTKGGVQVLVLSNPVYDAGLNLILFTAESLFGTTPIETGFEMNHPTLFIDGADGNAFPTYTDNHFSIQYRNSTAGTITVWLNGAQPPCSQSEAANCQAGRLPENYTDDWANMQGSFTASGTHFYIHSKTAGTLTEIDVTNRIDLEPGQTLRIVPPLDENNYPQWYYTDIDGVVQTAGVTGWATQQNIDMPAPMRVNLFEYNLDYAQLRIWADISGVDGINLNASMALEGAGCGDDATCGSGLTMPRKVMTNIDPYDGENDGCPYVMVAGGANTCPNPKFYPATISGGNYPSWVVGTDSFTTDDVEYGHPDIWSGAGSPNGFDMCSAALGDPAPKKAYHIWWSTNPVGQGWLDYLQNNAKGRCDAYGWAYDEKRWKTGDTFDVDGNPPDNTSVTPQFNSPMQDDTYLNIDILKVM